MNGGFPKEQISALCCKIYKAIAEKIKGNICKCQDCDLGLSFYASVWLPCSKCGLHPDDENFDKIKNETQKNLAELFTRSNKPFKNFNADENIDIKFELPPRFRSV